MPSSVMPSRLTEGFPESSSWVHRIFSAQFSSSSFYFSVTQLITLASERFG